MRNVKNFQSIAIVNADNILPDDVSLFDLHGKLSGKGLVELWQFLDKTIELVDKPKSSVFQGTPYGRSTEKIEAYSKNIANKKSELTAQRLTSGNKTAEHTDKNYWKFN